jgi:hypothetical protein
VGRVVELELKRSVEQEAAEAGLRQRAGQAQAALHTEIGHRLQLLRQRQHISLAQYVV